MGSGSLLRSVQGGGCTSVQVECHGLLASAVTEALVMDAMASYMGARCHRVRLQRAPVKTPQPGFTCSAFARSYKHADATSAFLLHCFICAPGDQLHCLLLETSGNGCLECFTQQYEVPEQMRVLEGAVIKL